ncbi:MAG: phenylacetate-CoA oxygenase subunit PaaJ [Betaproteobacteria bacterium]|nr:MAG: phenylacetate-CoA oxygenase subunit PaaJ [Betaproteobacteria bacterium]
MVAALTSAGPVVSASAEVVQRDAAVWRTLARVPDPEIPVISIVDLGIVRGVEWRGAELVVTVTPTYSGCPATELIMADIGRALVSAGFAKHRLEIRLSPAWTTDWIAPEARARLSGYGIAPPGAQAVPGRQVIDTTALLRRDKRPSVPCPRCASVRTRELSRFGSTPCKAQYRCDDCLEPFDYFKPH